MVKKSESEKAKKPKEGKQAELFEQQELKEAEAEAAEMMAEVEERAKEMNVPTEVPKVDPTQRKSTAKARAEGGKAGRDQKKVYTFWKEEVLKHEEDNYSKLYIVHEKNKWWKMFGHSAVIFHYDIAKWAKIRSRLQDDTDFGAKSEEGVVNIKDIYELDDKLAKAKVSLTFVSDHIRIYNIGKKYTEADINAMIEAEELAWSRANQNIKPKEIFPSFYSFLLRLLSNVYFVTMKMDKVTRAIFGVPMTRILTEMMSQYVMLCNRGEVSKTNFLDRAEEDLDRVKGYVACLMETRAIKLERAQSILYDVDKLKRTIRQCRPKKVE